MDPLTMISMGSSVLSSLFGGGGSSGGGFDLGGILKGAGSLFGLG